MPKSKPNAIHPRLVRQRTEDKRVEPIRGITEPLCQFHNAMLVTEDGLREGDLWVQGGKIVDPEDRFWQRACVSDDSLRAADRRIDCEGMLLAPGFIDIMLHTAFGVEFSTLGRPGAEAEAADADAIALVSRRLPELGVTSFCPALRSCSSEDCARAMSRLKRLVPTALGARCLGAHLDGPFFDHEQATSSSAPDVPPPADGAHVRDTLVGDALALAYGQRACEAAIVTLAPELPGAVAAIEELVRGGVVVGIGRTAATLAQSRAAVDAGATLVSHVMSNMPPFKHRDPGPVGLLAHGTSAQAGGTAGEGVDKEGVFFSLVVSNLHSATVNLTHATHPEGLILLSELTADAPTATPAVTPDNTAGLKPPCNKAGASVSSGVSDFDAGSIAHGARQLCRTSGATDPAAALLCGSAHPAKLLGLSRKGRLSPGGDGDLVLLCPADLTVRACFVGGELAWSHPDLHGAFWYHS